MDECLAQVAEDEFLTAVNDGLSIIQKKEGLRYGTDALLLAAYVRSIPSGTAVDLGAGSGIISLLCAVRRKFARIHAVEVQEAFADIIDRNAALNSLTQVTSWRGNVTDLRADTFGEVEAVFTNPPFMRAEDGRKNEAECKHIARHEVKGTVGDFCAAAGRILKYGGLYYVVFRPERLRELFSAMEQAGIEPKRMTVVAQTPQHIPSLVLVEGKKGAAPGMRVTKNLFLADEAGKPSADMKEILERGEFGAEFRAL